jgi:hypothetical protein
VFKDGLRHTVMDKRHGTASSKNSSSSSSAAAQVGNARYFSRAELRDLFTLGAPGETRALNQIEQRHGTLQQVLVIGCILLLVYDYYAMQFMLKKVAQVFKALRQACMRLLMHLSTAHAASTTCCVTLTSSNLW